MLVLKYIINFYNKKLPSKMVVLISVDCSAEDT